MLRLTIAALFTAVLAASLCPLSCKKNSPPYEPARPSGPSSGLVDSTYTFTTAAYDPDGDSVAIRFDWGDGDTSAWSAFVGSGETITGSKAWSDTGTSKVRCRAKDVSGSLSAWSASLEVYIKSHEGEATLRWRYQTGGRIDGVPTVKSDGTIYVGSSNDKLTALNADGAMLWEYTTGAAGGFGSTAIAPDGTVYACRAEDDSRNYLLYAFTPTGTRKWTFPVPSYFGPNYPTVGDDGTVYVSAGGWQEFYAVNPAGTQKWVFSIGAEVCGNAAPPVAADGTAYCGGWWSNSLSAVSSSGSEMWSCYLAGGVTAAPSIGADGTIYVGTVANRVGSSEPSYLYAVRPDGSSRWSYLAGGHIRTSPAIGSDGTIYFGAEDGRLYALYPDGGLKWDYAIATNVSCPAVLDADGTVYVGSHDNRLYAINPNGTLRWTYTAGGPVGPLAIGPDGTIYFGSNDGYLYAIGGSAAGSPDGWPMFQHDCRHTSRAGGP